MGPQSSKYRCQAYCIHVPNLQSKVHLHRNLRLASIYGGDIVLSRDKPICGRVDKASSTEAVDPGPIPGLVKSKTIKIDIHSFLV